MSKHSSIDYEDGIIDFDDIIDKPKKRIRRTKAELKPNYVDPAEMEKSIKDFYASGTISDSLADSIQKIATRLGFAGNFINYSYKEEMIGDAVIKMMTALLRKRFKVDSGYNPFSYFTKVAYRAFQNRIKREKKEHDTMRRYQAEVYNTLAEGGLLPARKNKRECEDESNVLYDDDLDTNLSTEEELSLEI
jgi:hypothetical protein